nr:MAG TPA: hypothetical protein [Caudoviricetes sp.]
MELNKLLIMKTVLTVVVLLILGALRLFEYRHRDY